MRSAERTGRPLGGAEFVAGLEQSSGRVLARRKPGRTPRDAGEDQARLV